MENGIAFEFYINETFTGVVEGEKLLREILVAAMVDEF